MIAIEPQAWYTLLPSFIFNSNRFTVTLQVTWPLSALYASCVQATDWWWSQYSTIRARRIAQSPKIRRSKKKAPSGYWTATSTKQSKTGIIGHISCLVAFSNHDGECLCRIARDKKVEFIVLGRKSKRDPLLVASWTALPQSMNPWFNLRLFFFFFLLFLLLTFTRYVMTHAPSTVVVVPEYQVKSSGRQHPHLNCMSSSTFLWLKIHSVSCSYLTALPTSAEQESCPSANAACVWDSQEGKLVNLDRIRDDKFGMRYVEHPEK